MRLRTVLLVLMIALCRIAGAAPSQIHWSAVTAPADARVGEAALVEVTAQIEPGWHLYSLTQAPGGPTPTTLKLQSPGLTPLGKALQPPPVSAHDSGFNMQVELFTGQVTFGLPVRVAPGKPGARTGIVQVGFQLCNDRSCLPPTTVTLPVRLEVTPGSARKERLTRLPALPAAIPQKGASAAPGAGAVEDNFTLRVHRAESNGPAAFLWLSFSMGLLALLTPCVFPMVPITVSFFSKRKESAPGQNLRLALAYCAGIIATFTAIGLIMTALFGAGGIQKLATGAWVNLALAALFVVLAFNLLGFYEVVLPGRWAQAAAGNRYGGLIGALLMGFAFTLTSFTCTAPFVGTLLVAASQGSTLFPLFGMLAFSTAFALPFFLLALFPQALAKLPRAGSWMVTMKAYLGILELAAALKFLSNADLVWQLGILTRPVFLVIWAVLAAIAGVYLLGGFRLAHETKRPPLGPTRITLGVLTLLAGVYCLAALRGAPLGEWDSFVPPSPYPGSAAARNEAGAWTSDYNAALRRAVAENRAVLINFTGVTCTNCRWMEKNMFTRPEIRRGINRYVPLELYTDRATPADEANKKLEERLIGSVSLPAYVIVSPGGKPMRVFSGLTRDPAEFERFLRE